MRLGKVFKKMPFWLKFAVIFTALWWTISYAHDLFFLGYDDYFSLTLGIFIFPIAVLVYDSPLWIRLAAYIFYLLFSGSIIGLIIQLVKSKISKKP